MQSSDDSTVRDRQLFALLHVAEEDLNQATFFAAHILKKGWHFEPWEKRWTVYMQQAAYTTALVTSYARPFTESRGWPKFPDRLLRTFSATQRKLHERILVLRNMIYAHSDIGSRFIRPINLSGYPTAIESLPSMRLVREDLIELQSMISVVQNAIRERKYALLATAASEA